MPRKSAGAALASIRWAQASPAERKAVGQLRAKPTTCAKCGALQPTARQARAHCAGKRNKG